MNTLISRLGLNDAKRALAAVALFFDGTDAIENLTAFLSNDANILIVAEIDNAPIGLVVGYVLQRWDSKPPMLFLYSIDVHENHRRKRIGSRMIEAFRAIGRTYGCGDTFVFTNASNSAAMKLYDSTGAVRPNPDDVMFEYHEQTNFF